MKLWNPAAFFISLIMSFFNVCNIRTTKGMPVDSLFYLWPVRWVTAYLLINIVVYPIGFGLAKIVFGFDPLAND